MANNVCNENFSEPLNGTTMAKVDISTGAGNITIDRLADGGQVLASGELQYLEDQGIPDRSMDTSNGQTTFKVKETPARRSWFRFPWAACIGGNEWRIHLNPKVVSDITAHSGGGNVKLDLAGTAVTHVSADTGGGNMDVVLPDSAANLSVDARTGAGNVTVDFGSGVQGTDIVNANSGAGNVVVRIPRGVAARIHATSGLGKVTVDPRYSKIDKNTYESSDYDIAANKVEITVKSGAGSVSVSTK